MKTRSRLISGMLLALTIISCQVNFESTFHNDKTTSMVITMTVDDFNGYPIKELPEDWVSFYDMKKKFGETLPTAQDSVKFLKAVQVKYTTNKGVFKGFSMRINRANEADLELFSTMFQDMNPGSKANKEKSEKLDRLDVKWDGKKLIIPTGGDVSEEINGPEENRSEAKSKESLDFFKKTFDDANFIISYTFIFENKIKNIQGKHDLIKKIDDHRVEFKIDMLKIMENEVEGTKPKNTDKEIIITVE